ncbi:MAG TPA: hypothetical protein VHT75_07560 [Acidimicrobiales bacterium]|jgi:hypothetical protein|nr:hypothetical protein [Acidimicrobiales bacterium]
MVLRVLLSVVDVLLLVIVLAYFLNRVARLLNSISATLGKVTFGVRAVESQCAVIGPAADQINANLTVAAGNLERAAMAAERLAG